MAWHAISHHSEKGMKLFGSRDPEESVMRKLQAAPDFLAQMQKKMHPGMVMIVTDAPLSPDSRSDSGFRIMTTHHEEHGDNPFI
jgi:hypothetical protein